MSKALSLEVKLSTTLCFLTLIWIWIPVLNLSYICPLYLSSLKNATSEETSPDDPNLKVVTFGTSPIMSTYLVAFVIGEFDYVESKSTDGVDVRVFTPLGKKEQGDFALEVS